MEREGARKWAERDGGAGGQRGLILEVAPSERRTSERDVGDSRSGAPTSERNALRGPSVGGARGARNDSFRLYSDSFRNDSRWRAVISGGLSLPGPP